MKEYLKSSEIIDFNTSLEIMLLAKKLAAEARDQAGFVKIAFEYVRDKIAHSADINQGATEAVPVTSGPADGDISRIAHQEIKCNPADGDVSRIAHQEIKCNPADGDISRIAHQKVTCKASEVLREGQGICYAKSHLLAAILRCNGVPAGFCYQRLILDDVWFPHLVLHGLNAVFLEKRWVRLDARGNKPGVYTRFSLKQEMLAFHVRREKGEEDLQQIFAEPDKNVIHALTSHKNFKALWANLPTELWKEDGDKQPPPSGKIIFT